MDLLALTRRSNLIRAAFDMAVQRLQAPQAPVTGFDSTALEAAAMEFSDGELLDQERKKAADAVQARDEARRGCQALQAKLNDALARAATHDALVKSYNSLLAERDELVKSYNKLLVRDYNKMLADNNEHHRVLAEQRELRMQNAHAQALRLEAAKQSDLERDLHIAREALARITTDLFRYRSKLDEIRQMAEES